MKTFAFCFSLAVCTLAPSAHAQLFGPETLRGAVWGGAAGAVIGHNDGRHGWEGAAYGAAAGALIGTWVGESRLRHAPPVPHRVYRSPGYRPAVWLRVPMVDRASHRHPGMAVRSGWHPTVAYQQRPYDSDWRRPDVVRSGVLLGGLAGAIIGHNDGRRGWEGAALGAGAGWLLGSVVEQSRQRAENRRSDENVPVSERSRLAEPAPTTVIHNHYYGGAQPGAMSRANGLFGR